MLRFLPLLLLALVATAAQAQTSIGELTSDDPTLADGEYYDSKTVELAAGDRLSVRLVSAAFDTYLVIDPPEGEWIQNDDCTEGDYNVSCISLTAPMAGTYTIMSTSYEGGETGLYELTVTVNGD